MKAIVSLTEVSRFHAGLPVLKDVNLVVPSGQTCAIVGPSGSGKSTLLNLIGLLERPCSGRVQLVGNDMTGASADQCAVVRNRLIGFVFQSFNLLPRLSALDNVALPLSYRGLRLPAARVLAQNQLEAVGIGELGPQRSAELSGG